DYYCMLYVGSGIDVF
nr:immunoglobulin light chain junction region [Macaca mulatta]MOX69619.1 immunoglobulin light chain junction region [Macaca mulatta]MOX70146.1 immunoglobulin light chain junction region [Macaca mulatta]MOX70384.1 immunoglobulin light chain junction region [Macaca mulatta]MOX70489.1 immunoglobulin light chain junction region [Macaca mulatta]